MKRWYNKNTNGVGKTIEHRIERGLDYCHGNYVDECSLAMRSSSILMAFKISIFIVRFVYSHFELIQLGWLVFSLLLVRITT